MILITYPINTLLGFGVYGDVSVLCVACCMLMCFMYNSMCVLCDSYVVDCVYVSEYLELM